MNLAEYALAHGLSKRFKLERVLTSDPGMGVARHADAGYQDALDCSRQRNVAIPGLNY